MRSRIVPLVLLCAIACTSTAFAQNPVAGFQESVSLNTDSTVVKRLATLNDYIAGERWNEAFTLLRDISETHGDVLVPLQPGRYINAANYCNRVLAGLPPAGLAACRAKIDPQARQWFQQGHDTHDEALLRKLVDQAFVSSFADNALRLLGDWAWEGNELPLARSCWERMLHPHEPPAPGEPLDPLRYPDTDHNLAEIRARLVLCTALQGDLDQAQRERQAFAEQHPDAEGTLAGRSGNLSDTLAAVIDEARQWNFETRDPGVETFALNAQRNGIVPAEIDVGAPAWVVSLPENPFPGAEDPRPGLNEPGPLSYHPVTSGKMLLLSDTDRIYAFHLETGRPWYDIPLPDAATTADPKPAPLRRAVLYRSAVDSPRPVQPSVGTPRYTLTLHEGRIYAKMGSPVTGTAPRELRDLQSDLICFDPVLSQGKLLWRVPASDLGDGWMFEGSPVVEDGRVYAVVRRRHPQTQISVACFDADTGRLQWNRDVCAAVGDLREGHNRVSHQLLTLAENTLFLSTDLGALATVDARDGRLLWVATYESHQPQEELETSGDAAPQGLVPCLYHRGTVIAAPNDSPYVMAFDAQDGRLRWRTWLPDHVRHLLGVGQDRVILSGDRLWGLNVETGALEWNSADHVGDPEARGYGRGLLVADKIYWPKRGAIEIRDQRTGRTVDLVDLTIRGSRGGNLLIAGEYLVIAEPDRLIAFSQESGPIDRPRQIVDSRPLGAAR